jgi:hypothetical protein
LDQGSSPRPWCHERQRSKVPRASVPRSRRVRHRPPEPSAINVLTVGSAIGALLGRVRRHIPRARQDCVRISTDSTRQVGGLGVGILKQVATKPAVPCLVAVAPDDAPRTSKPVVPELDRATESRPRLIAYEGPAVIFQGLLCQQLMVPGRLTRSKVRGRQLSQKTCSVWAFQFLGDVGQGNCIDDRRASWPHARVEIRCYLDRN